MTLHISSRAVEISTLINLTFCYQGLNDPSPSRWWVNIKTPSADGTTDNTSAGDGCSRDAQKMRTYILTIGFGAI